MFISLRKNFRIKCFKKGLFNKQYYNITNNFIKELSSIPFNYESNKNIMNNIFDKCEKLYGENSIENIIQNFKLNYIIK